MANSREAQFKRDTIEGRTLHGWQVVADYGYDHEGEEASKLDLTYYHLTKREEKGQRLEEAEGDYGLTSVSEVVSGKPHDLEKQCLVEIIDRLNELSGAEASDNDKLHFANGIDDRPERDEMVVAVDRNRSANDDA